MEVLQAKDLKKIYGSGNNAVHALDGVDLSVKKEMCIRDRIRSPLRPGSHRAFCRAETDRCLFFGNLSGCVPDRRPFYLYVDAKNCGTDGEATGSGRETGATHGGKMCIRDSIYTE